MLAYNFDAVRRDNVVKVWLQFRLGSWRVLIDSKHVKGVSDDGGISQFRLVGTHLRSDTINPGREYLQLYACLVIQISHKGRPNILVCFYRNLDFLRRSISQHQNAFIGIDRKLGP